MLRAHQRLQLAQGISGDPACCLGIYLERLLCAGDGLWPQAVIALTDADGGYVGK